MFFGTHIATALQNVNLENLPPRVADDGWSKENFYASLPIDKDGCHELHFTEDIKVSLGPETLLILPHDGSEIGVENLPLEVNETDVSTIFEEHGTIRKFTSSKDIKSTKMVLLFASPVMAESALRKNCYHFQGNILKVYIIKGQNCFSCFFPYSWNEDEFKDAINKLGPGVEGFIFRDEKEINRVGVAVKQATVSYFNRQCAWYSFHKIGQPGFKFEDIEPSPFWIVAAEKKQSYIEALGKDNCETHVSLKYEQLLYACRTCGISESVTSLCKARHHVLMSKEDYALLETNKNAKYSCFPIQGKNIQKGDFIINVDASCSNEIGFGVVIRTSTMEFFLNRIGGPYPKNNRTSYDAETLALEYAIQVGLTTTKKGKLFIFTDCLPIEICFNTGKNISCGHNVKVDRELVNRCRIAAGLVPWIEVGKPGSSSKLLVTKREVKVFHVHRELNQAADAVAKRATSRDSDFNDRTPIREIRGILKEDKFLYRVIKKKMLGVNV